MRKNLKGLTLSVEYQFDKVTHDYAHLFLFAYRFLVKINEFSDLMASETSEFFLPSFQFDPETDS